MTPSYCIPLHFCINNRALSLMFRVLLVGVRIGFCFRRWGQEGASGEMKREFFSLILPPPLPILSSSSVSSKSPLKERKERKKETKDSSPDSALFFLSRTNDLFLLVRNQRDIHISRSRVKIEFRQSSAQRREKNWFYSMNPFRLA